MSPYKILVDCFYNQYGECLLRGTNWVFKYDRICVRPSKVKNVTENGPSLLLCIYFNLTLSAAEIIFRSILCWKRSSKKDKNLRTKIGLKFKEESSEVLHLERSFVCC
jgi:hypothetical protein